MSEAKVLYIHPSKRSGKVTPNWIDFYSKEMKLTRVPNLSYKDSDMIVENPLTYTAAPGDLDKLDFVNLDFLKNHRLYYKYQSVEFDVITSHWLCLGRGCKIDCSFCGGGKNAHKIFRPPDLGDFFVIPIYKKSPYQSPGK